MDNDRLQQIARALYYAPTPCLVIDNVGSITDYNLALETVFGDALSGRRYLPLQELLDALRPRVVRGALIAQDGNGHAAMGCNFDSPNLEEVLLTSRTVECRDPVRSEKIGQMVFWDVVSFPGSDEFHELYRDRLDHQLIWDTYAWSYDRVLPLVPYYQDVLERHVSVMTSCPDGPVMDLGGGTGNLAERLILADRSVTVVDNSRAMLDKLHSKQVLASAIGTRLTVVEARAQSLPMIEDQSQAAVSLQLALFDMRNPELGLRTAVRVLRPGGWIVVTDLKRSFQLEPLLQECERQLRSLGLYEQLAEDLHRVVRSNHDLAPGSRSSFRIEDVFEFLGRESFKSISIQDSHLGQCATVTAQKPHDATGTEGVASLR